MPKFTIIHTPSNDEAEADSLDAAFLAATTLIRDNMREGRSDVYAADVIAVAEASPDRDAYLRAHGYACVEVTATAVRRDDEDAS